MPELNWDVFEGLPGASTSNWELLCRELVRRNYARFGKFRSIAQQPGIEFHLDLDADCDLGDATGHWGWQCRWYGLDAGRQIGTTRRKQIEKAIRTTEEHLPNLTDWVLWTRRSLTPTDQKWYYELVTNLNLLLWAEEEIIGLLTGEAEVLKATYFGDLVISPEKLHLMHDEAMAPIRKRWEPLLHVEVDVERDLKAALGTPGTWPVIRETCERFARRATTLRSECHGLGDNAVKFVESAADLLDLQSEHLRNLADALDNASMPNIRNALENPIVPSCTKPELASFAAWLRSANHPASLPIAAAIGEVVSYHRLLEELSDTLEQNLFAVIGDAGFGKTYLAAELTKPSDDFPGGVLLLAKYLPSNRTLDDLAKRVPFGGERMEQLFEAIDAAGARLGRRMPIVIDGLNESENPRDWKGLLETLKVQLERTTNCVVIVTLRSAVAKGILPHDARKHYLSGFAHEPEEAIRTYFDYYKIDATDAHLHWGRFSSPLYLSLFCKATNPDRQETVGLDRIPRSPTAVFERYREVVVSQAAESLDIATQDVALALEKVGLALWNENARTLEFDVLRKIVGDQPRAWRDSLARVLEEEGVLSRDPFPLFRGYDTDGNPTGNQVSAILYDAFAGFVLADAIISQQGLAGFPAWISENSSRLDVLGRLHHPLAEDILKGLVGLLPRRHHCQLWPSLSTPMREVALLETANLEIDLIDKITREQLIDTCKTNAVIGGRDVFFLLRSTRSFLQHPLSAGFLHEMLSSMEVAQRDLKWTEWIRREREVVVADLERLEQRWRRTENRDERDRLNARWVSWTLTSTVRYLRDQATESLYWYGIGAPQPFFEMAVESLDINDSYVPERMFAAAYGIVMGRQCDLDRILAPVTQLLEVLGERLIGDEATTPTNHWMLRVYIQGIVDFAMRFLPESVPDGFVGPDGQVLFASATYIPAESVTDQHSGYLGRDFENYTVGRLFADRSNYDYGHEPFQAALTEVRGRVWDLGYREADFKEIDSDIGRYYPHRNEPDKTERYAKKYGWIGFYEKVGVLADAKILSQKPRSRRCNPIVDIDPSFPRVPPNLPLEMPDWTASTQEDDREWLGCGEVTVPDALLRMPKIGEHEGPWIAVNGFLEQSNKVLGRQTFGFIRGILAERDDVGRVLKLLTTQDYLGNDFIAGEPSDYYTFAGEIPWSDEFATDDDYDGESGPYRGRIGGYRDKHPVIEVLSHCYAWESYHSSANKVSNFSVPSKSFSKQFDLRSLPSSFYQIVPDSTLATISLSPPEHFQRDGNVLYLREDLLREYANAKDMELIWAVWGERNLTNLGYNYPDWCQEIYKRHGHLWRRIATCSDLQA